MRLDPRIALPAALAAAAIFVPAGPAAAERPATLSCPDGYTALPLGAFAPDKDKNRNDWVCVKDGKFKDDTCNPNCNQEEIMAVLATLADDDILDDEVPTE